MTTGRTGAGTVPYRHRLPDGRRLAWAEYGDPDGLPVVYCHGLPGSRLEAAHAADAAHSRGVRLIAPDRPGVGESDPDPNRSLASWAQDVAALADALGLARFSVLGVSGGGPYALACLDRIPHRLHCVVVAGGVGAPEHSDDLQHFMGIPRLAFALAWRAADGSRAAERLFHGFSRILAPMLRRRPAWAVALMKRPLDPVDVTALAHPRLADILARSFREAARQGPASAARDLMLYVRPWELAFPQKGVPVHFWHGQRDRVVPWRFGERQAARVPGAQWALCRDEGHYSLLVRRMGDMLDAIRAVHASGFGPHPVRT